MKTLFKIIVIVFAGPVCFSQALTTKADSLRRLGRLDKAIPIYKKVYSATPENQQNTYNLACAYALTYQIDSAYSYLDKALKKDASLWALADPDLYALANDARWTELQTQQLEKYQNDNGPLKAPQYTKALLTLIVKDQALDFYVDLAKRDYVQEGYIPAWYYPLGAMKQRIVRENFQTLKTLINAYGWPKYSQVGTLAADAPLLVINHHESDSVRKAYLPVIKQACLEGEGSCLEYAKIQDRILVNDGNPQLYGMQFRYTATRQLEPFPILDPEHVDARRKAIGLESLKTYLKRKINYDWRIVQKDCPISDIKNSGK